MASRPVIAEPGRTNPSRRSSARRSSGRFSNASRTMIESGRGRPSGSRATAPKSSTRSRPSSSSWKLPGCGSACSRPARGGDEIVQLGQQRGGVISLGLGALADDDGQCPAGDPLRDHAPSARRHDLRHADLVSPSYAVGEGALRLPRRGSRAPPPSGCVARAISGLISRPGMSGCSSAAHPRQLPTGRSARPPAPGYCTLTATTRPSCQTPRCTWPMLAAAAGVSSKETNRARQPRPNCSASMRWTSAVGIGGCGRLEA